MPLRRCGSGWRWGSSGHCYTGSGARALALRQGRAIHAARGRLAFGAIFWSGVESGAEMLPLGAPYRVRLSTLWASRQKLMETAADIAAGRLSFSMEQPLVVSRLDSPRGAYFLTDGHHRVVQSIRGAARRASAVEVLVAINPYLPRIERTGGAFTHMLSDKVQIVPYVSQRPWLFSTSAL